MELNNCSVCLDKKTVLKCNCCLESSCKHCSFLINEGEYEYLSLFNEKLEGDIFCPNCYYDKVEPVLNKYSSTFELAKDVNAYVGNSDLRARAIRRIEKPVKVEDCASKEDTLLRLGFLTAQKGFATMVDVELNSKKIGGGKRYKKLVWSGRATPVDPSIKRY